MKEEFSPQNKIVGFSLLFSGIDSLWWIWKKTALCAHWGLCEFNLALEHAQVMLPRPPLLTIPLTEMLFLATLISNGISFQVSHRRLGMFERSSLFGEGPPPSLILSVAARLEQEGGCGCGPGAGRAWTTPRPWSRPQTDGAAVGAGQGESTQGQSVALAGHPVQICMVN